MTTGSAPAGSPPAMTPAVPAVSAPATWPWRRAALLLACAAQLITISALVGADPPPVTWAALVLAIAPAPVAAVAAFAPAPVSLLAGAVGMTVLVIGIAAHVTHTGLFFVPALGALAVGTVKLWREQP